MQQQSDTAVGRFMAPSDGAAEALLGSTDTAGAARFLNLGTSTLEKLRVTGGGPVYVKASNGPNARVSYTFADLRVWQDERKRSNTAGTSPLKGKPRQEHRRAAAA
jgi:hypothetical protein